MRRSRSGSGLSGSTTWCSRRSMLLGESSDGSQKHWRKAWRGTRRKARSIRELSIAPAETRSSTSACWAESSDPASCHGLRVRSAGSLLIEGGMKRSRAAGETTLDLLAMLREPARLADPYPLYGVLRQRAPVRLPTGEIVFTRYRDVASVLKDQRFGKPPLPRSPLKAGYGPSSGTSARSRRRRAPGELSERRNRHSQLGGRWSGRRLARGVFADQQ